MPFFVYDYEQLPKGHTAYRRLRQVSLAGIHGPIVKIVKEGCPDGADTFNWHAPESRILSTLGADPTLHQLVIDLKPSAKDTVSLYRLRDVWGCSEREWTPLMLRLSTLFVDNPTADPESFKIQFEHDDEDTVDVHEFLYVQGGTKEGTWNWGRVGSVNGTLLWPRTLDYFVGVLRTVRSGPQ